MDRPIFCLLHLALAPSTAWYRVGAQRSQGKGEETGKYTSIRKTKALCTSGRPSYRCHPTSWLCPAPGLSSIRGLNSFIVAPSQQEGPSSVWASGKLRVRAGGCRKPSALSFLECNGSHHCGEHQGCPQSRQRLSLPFPQLPAIQGRCVSWLRTAAALVLRKQMRVL